MIKMFVSPGDIAFSIGAISVHYYGIIMALSLILGICVARFVAKKWYPDLDPEIIYDISPHVIIGAIIGARLYYCLLDIRYYAGNPFEIIKLWHGGLSIHGAIIGGFLIGLIYCKRHKLPVLKLCDIFSYGLILGQSLGRWGNFFNSEAFGTPTNNFLKLYIPIYNRPLEYMQYNYFHPTFLYESVLDVCIFLVLIFLIRKFAKNVDGVVFFSYLILYSVARIVIEQVRIDSVLNVFGVPIAQIVSVCLIVISTISIFVIQSRNESTRRN